MQVLVDISDKLAAHLPSASGEVSRGVVEAAAVEAYCRDAITRSELQMILQLDTDYELDGFLKHRGIDHGSYSGADFMNDIAALDRLDARK